ncbi:MAG: hypothetical protein ACLR8Y_08820 [Alistipes indistinctus]
MPHLLSLQLVPEPLGSLDQVIDLSDKIDERGPSRSISPKANTHSTRWCASARSAR